MNSIKYGFLVFLGLTLLSCSPFGRVKSPNAEIEAVMPEVAPTWSMAEVEQRVVEEPVAWIDRLNDPVLKRLVVQAQTNNPRLKAAAVNINRARALARQAGAALAPQLNAALGTDNSGLVASSANAETSVGLNLSWEIDLWGRLDARASAAEQSLAAVEADYRGARNLLAAGTAQAYFIAIEADQQRMIADQQVKALAEIVRIVKARSENGMASAQDVSLSLTDLASAKERLAEVEGAQRNALRALELLLGRYPAATTELPVALPTLPSAIAAGLPADVLERRPDITAAERRVAAALNLLHVAKAARLPSIRLAGELGGASNGLSNIVSEANLAWKATSSLLAPIFNAGALKAQVDVASADVELALAQYVETALQAFAEVETALDQSSVLERRDDLLQSAEEEAEKAYALGGIRYQEGESDLLDLLTIQQKLFAIQSTHLAVERNRLDQYIALSLALGGDW